MEEQKTQSPAPKSQASASSFLLCGLSVAHIPPAFRETCKIVVDLTTTATSQHIALNPSHAHPPGLFADPSSFCLLALCPLSQGLFLSVSHLARTEIHTIYAELEKKYPQAAKLTCWKQTATAKQTTMALRNLASDNESKALKLALNHLGLLGLSGKKEKSWKRKGKKWGKKEKKKVPDATSKLKQ